MNTTTTTTTTTTVMPSGITTVVGAPATTTSSAMRSVTVDTNASTAVVSLPIVVSAVAICVGLGIIVVVVNRLRKLDPVAFRRAISNGGAFQGVMLLAHLADVGLDVAACFTVITDPTTSTVIAALFGVARVVVEATAAEFDAEHRLGAAAHSGTPS